MNVCTLWLGAPASQMMQIPFHRQDDLPKVFVDVHQVEDTPCIIKKRGQGRAADFNKLY